jgi:FlaG/FlaF family flagellin (archaellin)
MREKSQKKSEAVSPVVGVMLMLVVTIIIAAIVSAFAGGLTSGNQNSKNIRISATYSQSGGMVIRNEGGDVMDVKDLDLVVRSSLGLGNDATSWVVNKSMITDVSGKSAWAAVVNTTSGTSNSPGSGGPSSGFTTFGPGSVVYILPPYHTGPYLNPGWDSYQYLKWFNTSANLGRVFTVELTQDHGNRILATTDVTIQP